MNDFKLRDYITYALREFNTAFDTEVILNHNSIERVLNFPDNTSAVRSSSDFWTGLAIPAITLYASKSYRAGNAPDYFAFIHDFDILVKALLVSHIPNLEKNPYELNETTYGGRDNIEFILDCIRRIDKKENDSQITAEKYKRLMLKAKNAAANDIGIHKKIADRVNHSFKLSRISRIQKLEYLLILDEFVKTRFYSNNSARPRISERDDYKICVDAMNILASALTRSGETDFAKIAFSVLAPHPVDFGEIKRRMCFRIQDKNAVHNELIELRQRINKAKITRLSSGGADVSVHRRVAKIISEIEGKEKD